MDTSPSFDANADGSDLPPDAEVFDEMADPRPEPERLGWWDRTGDAMPFWTAVGELRYGGAWTGGPARETFVAGGNLAVIPYDTTTFTREMSTELERNRLVCDPDEDAA